MIFYIIRNFLLYLYRNKLYTLITISGFAISIMFVLTVSWQSWQAARRNPVEALRYE
jgi:putative ABC transport system permease protein